jgi:hypothetical protein
MKPISRETIERTWQQMTQMEEEQALADVEKLGREQPAVLAYLMAAGGDIFDQDERELMLYLGLVVWKIMSQGETPLKKIAMENLDAEEETNFKILEDLAEESQGDVAAFTADMLADFNQIEVLRYVVEAIMMDEEFDESDFDIEEGDLIPEDDFDFAEDDLDFAEDDLDFAEDDIDIDENAKGMMLMYLKTVISCFDAA